MISPDAEGASVTANKMWTREQVKEFLASKGRSTEDSAVNHWLGKHGVKAVRMYKQREVELAYDLAEQRMHSGKRYS